MPAFNTLTDSDREAMARRDGWDYILPPNPVIATRPAIDGGTAILYANGTVCAHDGTFYSVSPGFSSLAELSAWIKEGV